MWLPQERENGLWWRTDFQVVFLELQHASFPFPKLSRGQTIANIHSLSVAAYPALRVAGAHLSSPQGEGGVHSRQIIVGLTYRVCRWTVGGKLEYLDRTHTSTGRTCKLHAERPGSELIPWPSCCEVTGLATAPTVPTCHKHGKYVMCGVVLHWFWVSMFYDIHL